MSLSPQVLSQPVPMPAAGVGLKIEAPWREAEGLQTFLRRQGIGTTLVLDPRSQEAHLEVWPGTDTAQLQQALCTFWRSQC